MTRAVVDQRIAEVQRQIDDAVSRKAYTECGPLQEKLDELAQKQADLPTIAELREAVVSAESKVEEAAKNRDFAGAASGQALITAAKERLAEALAADTETDEEETPTDLADEKENTMFGYIAENTG